MSRKPRRAVARAAARRLLDEHSVEALPVPVERIAAERTGGPVMQHTGFPQGAFGALSRRGNEIMIVVSSSCPNLGHRRFTIAHEVGHLVIDGHADQLFSSGEPLVVSPPPWNRSRPPIESEADMFAADLLLPPSLIRSVVESLPAELDSFECLGSMAETSFTAAAIAFATNFPEPIALVLTNDRTIQWVAASSAFLDIVEVNLWSARQEWAPKGSAAAELAKHPRRIAAGARANSYGLACEWFEDGPDIEVAEDCVGLGGSGQCLSLLSVLDA